MKADKPPTALLESLADSETTSVAERAEAKLQSEAKDTSETRYLRADRPADKFSVFLPREKGHRYYVDHREGLFYIRSNKSGRNFAIMTAPENDPAPKNWNVFAPASAVLHYAVRGAQQTGLRTFRVGRPGSFGPRFEPALRDQVLLLRLGNASGESFEKF